MNDNATVNNSEPRLSAVRKAAASAQRGRSGGARTGHAVRGPGAKQGAKKRARRPRNRENLSAALWLWCFPVGLSKMWRSGCTWRRGVKIGITAAMAAIVLAVLVFPTPGSKQPETGVHMVADTPEVEVYGPALPTLIVPGYTRESTGSIIVDKTSDDVHYVYAADGAECYHEYECKFAFASSQRLTVYEAYHLGFAPCGRCHPPVYVPGETDPITAKPLHSGEAANTTTTAIDDTAAQPAEQGETP